MTAALDRVQPLLDALPRAVMVLDRDGRIVSWNTVAAETFGWAADEVIGRLALEVLRPDGDGWVATFAHLLATGEIWKGEVSVRHRDGRNVRHLVAHRAHGRRVGPGGGGGRRLGGHERGPSAPGADLRAGRPPPARPGRRGAGHVALGHGHRVDHLGRLHGPGVRPPRGRLRGDVRRLGLAAAPRRARRGAGGARRGHRHQGELPGRPSGHLARRERPLAPGARQGHRRRARRSHRHHRLHRRHHRPEAGRARCRAAGGRLRRRSRPRAPARRAPRVPGRNHPGARPRLGPSRLHAAGGAAGRCPTSGTGAPSRSSPSPAAPPRSRSATPIPTKVAWSRDLSDRYPFDPEAATAWPP